MRLAVAEHRPHPPHRLMRPVLLRSACRLDRAVSWVELFFDLIFVAAVAQLASPLAEDYSFAGLFRFAFFFVLVWWAWLDHTLFYSRFHADDALQRVMTIAQIFAVAVMAANAKAALSSREAAGFGAAYGLMRLILMLQYLRTRGLLSPKRIASAQALNLGSTAILWVVAAISPVPLRYWIWTAALTIDAVGPWLRRHHFSALPPDAAHLPERFGLFTIILLGEFVAAVMRGMELQESWPPMALAAAIGGFCVAFFSWWIYFVRSEAAEPGAIPRTGGHLRIHLWAYLHLPLYLALIVTGVGVEHIIAGRNFGQSEAILMTAAVLSAAGALVFIAKMSQRRTAKGQVRSL